MLDHYLRRWPRIEILRNVKQCDLIIGQQRCCYVKSEHQCEMCSTWPIKDVGAMLASVVDGRPAIG